MCRKPGPGPCRGGSRDDDAAISLAMAGIMPRSHSGQMHVLRCPWCQDRIGVYEPIVVTLRDGSELTGSRLTLAAALADAGSIAAHADCQPGSG